MTPTQKEKKKIAGTLQPTVRVGRSGLTAAIVEEVKAQLKKRDAVKVKVLGTTREEMKSLSIELAERAAAELVETRGNTLTLWKKGG